jgi:hypothetical protein
MLAVQLDLCCKVGLACVTGVFGTTSSVVITVLCIPFLAYVFLVVSLISEGLPPSTIPVIIISGVSSNWADIDRVTRVLAGVEIVPPFFSIPFLTGFSLELDPLLVELLASTVSCASTAVCPFALKLLDLLIVGGAGLVTRYVRDVGSGAGVVGRPVRTRRPLPLGLPFAPASDCAVPALGVVVLPEFIRFGVGRSGVIGMSSSLEGKSNTSVSIGSDLIFSLPFILDREFCTIETTGLER